MEDGGANTPGAQVWTYVSYSQLLQYASDADGDALSIVGVSGGRSWYAYDVALADEPEYGRVAVLAPQNYVGGIAFDFFVSDGRGGVTRQTAHGMVTPVNDLPVASLELLAEVQQLASQYAKRFYRLNMWDVEDGANLTVAVNSYPLQSTVILGEAPGRSYLAFKAGEQRLVYQGGADFFPSKMEFKEVSPKRKRL